MTEWHVTSKADLLDEMEQTWKQLNSALDDLSEDQMTNLRDAQGWTVKEHISHLAAWERSALFFLQGRPRHEGLRVDEALYRDHIGDEVNEAIREVSKDIPLAEARAELRHVHEQVLAALAPMSDDDLRERYSYYLPDEPGDDDGRPAYDVVYGNTVSHFAEHRDWIRSQVAGRA